ncbi:hypothetical protein RC1_4091 [Rhodospirillum centenum SW]|uniref:Uncharacterized protein n=1 Tax=Rhodospirillum centenum (strain ATCC 51521 / SW) TaxID=414684 RepID=B6IYQ6_RHOCS|nr:hypothetical protein RC1_4091 [Rhodospirillum centenum SW]
MRGGNGRRGGLHDPQPLASRRGKPKTRRPGDAAPPAPAFSSRRMPKAPDHR